MGKIINDKGVMITPENIETMQKWPIPTNVKQLESFLGFMNYHRDHVKHFGEIVEPLHKLVSRKSEYKWTDQHLDAFQKLKDSLLHDATVLHHPDSDEIFNFRY